MTQKLEAVYAKLKEIQLNGEYAEFTLRKFEEEVSQPDKCVTCTIYTRNNQIGEFCFYEDMDDNIHEMMLANVARAVSRYDDFDYESMNVPLNEDCIINCKLKR
ncbi:MAG: hypothetical protein ACRDDZ_05925 [Marinifilaceae bacterium]